MIISVFSLQYPDEALECIEAGADWLGLLTGDYRCPAAVTPDQAKSVFSAIGGRAVKTAIIMVRDEEKVLRIAQELRPDILHLCDDTVFATNDFCERARKMIPGIKIMQGVAISGPEAVEKAKQYPAADYLMLDSYVAGVTEAGATPNGIGAAGVTHDWNISAQIVREADMPVILAGGLAGDNVADAIRAVRPFGVDSLTRTTIVKNGVFIRKDIGKVREFASNARAAAQELK